MPKGVGTTFCSKAEPFFVCACSRTSGVPVCAGGRGHILFATQRLCLCGPALQLPVFLEPCQPWNPDQKNGPSNARVCPKGSGPHSAAKQRRSFFVPALIFSVTLVKDLNLQKLWMASRAGRFRAPHSNGILLPCNFGRTSRWLRCTKKYTPTDGCLVDTLQALNPKPQGILQTVTNLKAPHHPKVQTSNVEAYTYTLKLEAKRLNG